MYFYRACNMHDSIQRALLITALATRLPTETNVANPQTILALGQTICIDTINKLCIYDDIYI